MSLAHFQRTFTDKQGNTRAGLSVEVRRESNGALAAIFEDRAGTIAKANPFTTDADGYGNFYAKTDRYRIQATGIDWRDFELSGADALNQRTIYVGSVAEDISGLAVIEGRFYDIVGWHTGSDVGGGGFVGRSSILKSEHNGGTIISPTVPPVSVQPGATLADRVANFLSGSGETDSTGSGVVVRIGGDGAFNPKWFGASSVAGFNNYPSISAAHNSPDAESVVLTSGEIECAVSFQFTKPVKFYPGAVIKVTAGVLEFFEEVDAGEYQIVSTADDFLTNKVADTSVKFWRHHVKAEWLGVLKVADIDDIQTVPDQTGNLLKAFRATVGNYVLTDIYRTENPNSLLKLGSGYYRTDQEFATGYNISGTIYYMTGSGIIGDGVSSSYLVRTDLTNIDVMCFVRYYTGELTTIKDFKVFAYDPTKTGSARFNSAASACMWFQGDSCIIDSVWAAGAQIPVIDTNGVERNAVGIQTESCVDTHFSNVFVELCNTNWAFSSSICDLVNITSFGSYKTNIGMGNFSAYWPDTQTTGNHVKITNMDCRSVEEEWLTVLSQGENKLYVNNTNVSGRQTGTGAIAGINVIKLLPLSSLFGSIKTLSVDSFKGTALTCGAGSVAGDIERPLVLEDLVVNGLVNLSPEIRGALTTLDCAEANVIVKRLTLQDCRPVVCYTSGRMRIEDVTLSEYQGVPDTSTNRFLFVQDGGELVLDGVTRNPSDTVALTGYGFQAAGSYGLFNIRPVPNSTRGITGTGTKEMLDPVAFA